MIETASKLSRQRSEAHSPYMEFAKLRSAARFNLATSGVESYLLRDLPVTMEDLELTGPSFYGYEPLMQRLAAHTGAPENCITAAIGTSLANYLALAATTEPGDQVLVEEPTYELIPSTAKYLGLEVQGFPRRFENGYQIDPGDIQRRITPRTRLIVLCNLHNPSSVLLDDAAIASIAEIARRAGIRMLVDEVYLDAAFDARPRSAYEIGPDVAVVTSSLTKAYGLSGLRCGWVVAPAAIVQKMWHIYDLLGAVPAYCAELLSVIAFDNLERIASRARALLARNRALLEDFLNTHDDLEYVRSPQGTTSFPRLRRGNADELLTLLQAKYETSVVPGRFFGEPRHFRIGLGGNSEMTAEGLHRLGQALDSLG